MDTGYKTNRIETVRTFVDQVLDNITDESMKKDAVIHLYGVAQASALLALKRKEDSELSVIAALMHDLYTYVMLDPVEHAQHSAEMAGNIMKSMECFSDTEIEKVQGAIRHHSDKQEIHTSFDEILKDADVMQHVLYEAGMIVSRHERVRYERLKQEFERR